MATDKVVAKDLSLCIAGHDAPFALIGPEQNLGPDDWAWQFLRLNHSYQREYANALAQHDPDVDRPEGTFGVPQNHPERKIRFAERDCRKHFGLSTWLDPQYPRLPKLKRGESWFFPLTRSPDSPEDGARVVAVEGVFLYLPIPFLGRYDRKRAEKAGVAVHTFSRPDVWFAVDCSVPPAAQMKSVEMVSRTHRDWLNEMKAEMHPRFGNAPGLVPLKECSWFDAETFDTASAAAENVVPSSLWYAIRVDVLGPIKEQVKNHLTTLNQAYLDLCNTGLAQPPIRERFRHEVKGPRDEDGEYLSDGNFLKALVICAQLAQRGLSEAEMVVFMEENAAASVKGSFDLNSIRGQWVTTFESRAGNYREQARKFVKGGYRWLVHAQKP